MNNTRTHKYFLTQNNNRLLQSITPCKSRLFSLFYSLENNQVVILSAFPDGTFRCTPCLSRLSLSCRRYSPGIYRVGRILIQLLNDTVILLRGNQSTDTDELKREIVLCGHAPQSSDERMISSRSSFVVSLIRMDFIVQSSSYSMR